MLIGGGDSTGAGAAEAGAGVGAMGADSAANMSSAPLYTGAAEAGLGAGGGATASSFACVMSEEKEAPSEPNGSLPPDMAPSERGGLATTPGTGGDATEAGVGAGEADDDGEGAAAGTVEVSQESGSACGAADGEGAEAAKEEGGSEGVGCIVGGADAAAT